MAGVEHVMPEQNQSFRPPFSRETVLLCDLTREQLRDELQQLGQPVYRAEQLWQWLYASLVEDFAAMQNLPHSLRTELAGRLVFPGLREVARVTSRDKRTLKSLFELHDGETIESVLMRYDRRRTVCVSTQVGCAIGCPFCATGQAGYRRDLSTGEIVEQVLFYARELLPRDERISNIVFMGMGEPLLNYNATWRAICTLNDERGLAMGARHMTISTAGIVPGIDRLATEALQVGLSISLHAADDALRDQLVPLNRRYPLSELLAACRRYVVQTRRRVTFEYALIAGVNDSVEQARKLSRLLHGLLCHVNLIPLNVAAGGVFNTASRECVAAFRQVLEDERVPVTVRVGRGLDIQAGCGQLRSRKATVGSAKRGGVPI